jgi:hypothetical protein
MICINKKILKRDFLIEDTMASTFPVIIKIVADPVKPEAFARFDFRIRELVFKIDKIDGDSCHPAKAGK